MGSGFWKSGPKPGALRRPQPAGPGLNPPSFPAPGMPQIEQHPLCQNTGSLSRHRATRQDGGAR